MYFFFISLGLCQEIDLKAGASITVEGVYVHCNNTKTGEEVYKNVHYFFPRKNIEKKLEDYKVRICNTGLFDNIT